MCVVGDTPKGLVAGVKKTKWHRPNPVASVMACADCHCLRAYACEFCVGAAGRRFHPFQVLMRASSWGGTRRT
jgi:hypothetical protein